jgi:hypothetical protein
VVIVLIQDGKELFIAGVGGVVDHAKIGLAGFIHQGFAAEGIVNGQAGGPLDIGHGQHIVHHHLPQIYFVGGDEQLFRLRGRLRGRFRRRYRRRLRVCNRCLDAAGKTRQQQDNR